jgi:N-acetylneuraminic acid mutarotase
MIFLFGGTDDEERLNDLYAYNIRANYWEKI